MNKKDILRENLKILCKMFTQEKIANMLGYNDRTTMSYYINGKTNNISIYGLLNLAQELNLSVDDLCNKKIIFKIEFENGDSNE